MAGKRDIQAGRAYVEMYVKNARFIRGLRNMQRRFAAFGAGLRNVGIKMMMAGGMITAPFLLAIKSFASAGDALDKMSARTTTSVEFLSKLSHAANIGGSDINKMEKGIRSLQGAAKGAERGLKTYVDSFDELGVSVKDNNGHLKDTETLWMETIDAISKVEDPTNKAALSQSIFGKKVGSDLLPVMQSLIPAMQEAKDLGIVMSAEDAAEAAVLTDAWTKLVSIFKMSVFQIGGALAPTMTALFDSIKDNSKAVIGWIKDNKGLIISIFKIGAGLAVAGAAAVMVGTVIIGLGSVCGAAAAMVTGLGSAVGIVTAIFGAILSPIGLVVAGVAGLVAYFLWASDSISGVLDWLKGGFGVLKDDALASFKGISDAMKAGDMKLAAKILWAFLKLQWQRGVNWISGIWEDFRESWTAVTNGIASYFFDTVADIKKAWAGMTGFLEKEWIKLGNSKASEEIGKALVPFFAEEGQDISEMKKTVHFNYELKRGEQAGDLSTVDKKTVKAKQDAEDERKKNQAGVNAVIAESVKKRAERELAAQAALDDAKAELAALSLEAGKKSGRAGLAADKPKPKPGEIPPPGMPTAKQLGGTAVGTFSAAQAAVMGGGMSLQERAYREQLDQSKTRKEMLNILRKMFREHNEAKRQRATA